MSFSPIDLANVAAGAGGFVIHGRGIGDRSGFSVASAGDVNGDGFDDLLIGAPDGDGAGNAAAGPGEAYVVFGKAEGITGNIDLAQIALGIGGFAIFGRAAGDGVGFSVGALGDFNGDGFDDLAIGAPFAGTPATGGIASGETYVVFGKAGSFATGVALDDVAAGTGGFVIHGEAPSDQSGYLVRTFGDINADGLDDLIIGSHFADPERINTGITGDTYVVFGQVGGFAPNTSLSDVAVAPDGLIVRELDIAKFNGFSAALIGDVNGDGYDDLLLGAPGIDGIDNLRPDSGATYLVFGVAGGLEAINLGEAILGNGGIAIFGEETGDASGRGVASAGDINGDGFEDIIIGAPEADGAGNGLTGAGGSYVIYGRDFTGQVTHLGDSSSETLTGGAAADRMVGGQGDDVLFGLGGADVLIGGAGSDTLHISDGSFLRVDGGSGNDMLVLDGSGTTIDLAAMAGGRIRNIERIDITGSGDNRIIVSSRGLLNLSTTSNILRIDGDVGDSLWLSDEPWQQGATVGGYTTFTYGRAVLQIDNQVACFASGTGIATPFGLRAVEKLVPGDVVLTDDGSAHKLVWCGGWDVDGDDRAHRAVRIRAHAFGAGRPARDLLVSPNHAIWLDGVMVPAVNLVDGARVVREPGLARRYHHIALAHHAVVLAEGLAVESFCPLGDVPYEDAPAVRDPLPRLEQGAALLRLRARWGLADIAGETGSLQGFVERILPVQGGIMVEGWASDGEAPVVLRVLAGALVRDLPANSWRTDLDRAGLPAAAFRVMLPVPMGTQVQVWRRADGAMLPTLAV